MKNYLFMFRTRTKVEFAARELAQLRSALPPDSKPLFFYNDGGVIGFRSNLTAADIIFDLDSKRTGPLNKLQDFALVEAGIDWRVKHTFGPLHSWLARYAAKVAA